MSLVKVAALFETSLQAKIAPAATTMTLVNGTDKDGNTLTGLYGLVIDEGSANEEFVIGTVAGTSVTAMIRDIDVSSPSIAGTGKDHRRGASVKITDYPFLGIIWRILSGNEGLESIIKYNSELTPTGQYDLVYKKWVEDRNGYWTGAVANFAALPIGTVEGEARVTLDDGKIYVWDVATATTATISSIDLGTNVITMTGAHGLSTGDYIYFATSGTLPAGLAVNTAYYVYVDSATELHVSLAIAGATVDITDAGTGTHTIKEASWVLAGAGGGAGTVYVTNKLGTGADDAPTNTTFSLTAGSWADQKYLQVYLNGTLQEYGPMEDYTTADSNTVVFNTGVEDTDKVTLLVVSVDLYNPAWGLVNADILPDTHNAYDIGATGNRFKDGFFESIDSTEIVGHKKNVATLTAGATINGATLPVPIYLDNTSDKVLACDGNDQVKLDFIGFAITNSTDTNPITVQTSGIVSGFTGLNIGTKYYVQDTVGTIGATQGTYEVLVGIATSATELLILKGSEEYCGSETQSGTTQTTDTFTMPAIARKAIITIEGAETITGPTTVSFCGEGSIYRKGKTFGFIGPMLASGGGGQINLTISGDTITATFATAFNSYTMIAYYYR